GRRRRYLCGIYTLEGSTLQLLVQGDGLRSRRHPEDGGESFLAAPVDADRFRPQVERLVAEHELAVEILGERVGVHAFLEERDGRVELARLEQRAATLGHVAHEAGPKPLAQRHRPGEV